jgi:photosystem II stability/assembly factor-like uncharacterized protein
MARALGCPLPVLLLLCALHAGPATAGLDRWTPLGPEGGVITALAADPGPPVTLYAGADGGIWKSSDGGDHWRRLAGQGLDPLALLTIRSLVADPGTPGRVFALTGNGTFRSSDDGVTWQRILSNAFEGAVDLAISPADPDVVMALVNGHVLRSNDGGDHWVLVLAPILPVETSTESSSTAHSLVFHPTDPAIVYVATVLGSVFVSTNAGLTWTFQRSWPVTENLVFDPIDPRTLYVEGQGSGSKSTDGGATWNDLPGLSGLTIEALAVDPTAPSVLLAGTAGGLWRSPDGGETWEEHVPGAPPALSLVADPQSGTIWLGSDGQGVFRSLDSGRTWLASRRGLNAASLLSAAFDPFRPDTLYTVQDGRYAGNAFRSTDHGATWSAITPPSTYGLDVLVPHPLREGVLFASGYLDFYRSTDRGDLWAAIPTESFQSFAFHPRQPDILFAGGFDGLSRSGDGGSTWDELDVPMPDPRYSEGIRQVLISPKRPDTVFVLTGYGRLVRSSNQGNRWKNVRKVPKVSILDSHPTVTGLHYFVTEEGGEIWRSLDDGVSWARIARGVGGGAPPTALRVDPRAPSNLYLGTFGKGVWRSRDGGVIWRPFNAGLTVPWITCLDADPRSPRHLLACTRGGGMMEIRLSS